MWKEYSEGKQTQEQIAKKIGKSREWVNKKFTQINCDIHKNNSIKPQTIVLIMDTTYFKKFGVMAFRSSNLRKNLLWYKVVHETNELYEKGIQELIDDGWTILAIVADGKPGLKKLFPNIPFQLCQFHQFQIITRYISKKPKLKAGKELRDLMFFMKETDKDSFEYLLSKWHQKWESFLGEKSINIFTNKKSFTHKRLRQAYFSLQRNLPYLFTSEKHFKEFEIPTTTNSLDGYFSHLKSKLSVHRGASENTQLKLISSIIFM